MSRDDLIDIEESARLLGVDSSTVRRLIVKRYIPFFRLGPKLIRLYRIDVITLQKRTQDTYSARLSFLARKLKYPSCS